MEKYRKVIIDFILSFYRLSRMLSRKTKLATASRQQTLKKHGGRAVPQKRNTEFANQARLPVYVK
jgi:hypothetical protein